jgi:Tetracyclin repressor-like, C-terminal domain
VLGELPSAYAVDQGWRAAVEASCREAWAFYQRHPWVLQVSGSRALLGPNEFAAYEAQMRLFDGLGLSGEEMVHAVGVVSSFVRGAAKAVSDARAAEQATGMSDDEWWAARAPFLRELGEDLWPERYPTLTRLAADGAFDQAGRPDDATPYTVREALDVFEFGLQRLLDGLEAYVERRGAGG